MLSQHPLPGSPANSMAMMHLPAILGGNDAQPMPGSRKKGLDCLHTMPDIPITSVQGLIQGLPPNLAHINAWESQAS